MYYICSSSSCPSSSSSFYYISSSSTSSTYPLPAYLFQFTPLLHSIILHFLSSAVVIHIWTRMDQKSNIPDEWIKLTAPFKGSLYWGVYGINRLHESNRKRTRTFLKSPITRRSYLFPFAITKQNLSFTRPAKIEGLPCGHGGLGNRVKKGRTFHVFGLLLLAFFNLCNFFFQNKLLFSD